MVSESTEEIMLIEPEKEFCDRLYQLLKNQALQTGNSTGSASAAILDSISDSKRKSGTNNKEGKKL